MLRRLLLAGLVLMPTAVHADLAPTPERLVDWDDHPPPMPPPPPEKDPLTVALVSLIGAGALLGVVTRRRDQEAPV